MKRNITSRAFSLIIASVMFTSCIGLVLSTDGDQANFLAPELLGCVTDNSVIVNVVTQEAIEAYFEYGTESGVYTKSTDQYSAAGGNPLEVVIDGLASSTEYYYRMVYRIQGDQQWIYRDEHSFHTQRSEGESFVFTITSDSHISSSGGGLGGLGNYLQALQNVLADNPDFNLDLGDAFMIDNKNNDAAVQTEYLYQRLTCMSVISGSVPIYLAAGNHENEEGWNFDDTPYSIALGSIKARKLYYPTPTEGEFYTGNDDALSTIYDDHLREDYYAWKWGDALFVVIDPFQYTMNLPYYPMAGEGNDDSVTGDQWSWTLGKEQYDWFKSTLENSDAKYKLVFSHHVTGGQLSVGGMGGGAGYVRGGANAAPYFEWGGLNADGTWGFDTMRPGWGNKSIHQLMVENGVGAYFHGHDHQYAYEKIDGVVYQEVPSPSMTGSGFNLYSESDPYTIKVLPNSGHLRVSVTSSEVSVAYVRSGSANGDVTYTYTIEPSSSGINQSPVANDQSVTTQKNTPVSITLTATDPENDELSYRIVSQPAHGTLSGTGSSGTYTPNSGYTGSDSFTFKVTDGWTESNIATVSVTLGG